MGNTTLTVSFPTDENGLTGRECPNCKEYFKLKFGTGIKTSICICPYCGQRGTSNQFFTRDQNEYMKSIVAKQVVEPMLRDFTNQINSIPSRSGGLLSVKISATMPSFQIKHYQEKLLETNLTCDNCGLEFAIFGVFSNCPDCGKLNARVIYTESLITSEKKAQLSEDHSFDENLRNEFLKDALVGSVAAFDSFGKALRKKYSVLPSQPRNLFQNFMVLDVTLATVTGKTITQLLNQTDRDFLFEMFQVRHLFEHNSGVVDNGFIRHLPVYSHLEGHKFTLKKDDVVRFINLMQNLGDLIYKEFE